MSAERHVRVREIFLEACERPAAERSTFVAGACGDDAELRREVESLLVHHDDSPLPTVPSPPLVDRRRPWRERFEPGQVFAGRYRVVSELGRGGMGEVFRAHDLVLEEPVALKFLPRSRPQYLERLLNEVRMARQVTHPNVCRVFDFGEADGEIFLTMEYIDGENLGSLLARIGRFPQDKLLDVAHQLCAGLAAAHAIGVLHRDLKPANIMIDGRGQAKITDFGIAAAGPLPATPDAETTPMPRREIVGTPAYMAPEQLAAGRTSVQSDLYALGLVLHEMATGRRVFSSATPTGYAELHRAEAPTPPSHQVSHLDASLEAAILRCLEKDPRDRPASARVVAAELPGGDPLRLALAAGKTPSPEVVAAGRAEALRPARARMLLALLALLLTGVLVLGDRAYPGREPWSLRPPEVLVERAAEILRQLDGEGPADSEDPPADRAWGFLPASRGTDAQGTGLFWYRQGPSDLLPSLIWAAVFPRVDFDDPPLDEAGMVRMVLDSRGRLQMLQQATASDWGWEESAADESGAGAVAEEPDWGRILALAGFELAALAAAAPGAPPPVYADQRSAWTVAGERIEAAAYRGRVVYFDAQPNAEEPPPGGLDFSGLFDLYIRVSQLFWLLLAVAAVFLARANLRAGRGDLRGARRLALFVVVANIVAWVFEADHVADLESEVLRLHLTLGRVLVEALIAWLAYIAIEPAVRRWWPRSLISWSRLLRGRLHDPLVGRSLLIGALVGSGWALLTIVDRLAIGWLGLEAGREIFVLPQLEVALKGRLLFATLVQSGVEAVTWAVLDLFFLIALRVVLRHWWLAIAVFVAVNGALETLEGNHPAVSWLTLGVGIAAVTAWVLVRFGLVAYAAALFCYFVLISAPVTLDFSAWYAETGLFALLVVAGLGAFGFWTALAGRPFVPSLVDVESRAGAAAAGA